MVPLALLRERDREIWIGLLGEDHARDEIWFVKGGKITLIEFTFRSSKHKTVRGIVGILVQMNILLQILKKRRKEKSLLVLCQILLFVQKITLVNSTAFNGAYFQWVSIDSNFIPVQLLFTVKFYHQKSITYKTFKLWDAKAKSQIIWPGYKASSAFNPQYPMHDCLVHLDGHYDGWTFLMEKKICSYIIKYMIR